MVDTPLLQVLSVNPYETPLTRSIRSHELRKTHEVPVMNVVNEKIEVNQSEGRNDDHRGRGYLPELPFPVIDVTDLDSWIWKCDIYCDLYQIPECHKTPLAVLHFNDTAIMWYRGVEASNGPQPWAVLKELVLERFKDWGAMNPMEELKTIVSNW